MLAAPLIQRLGGIQQQALVGVGDGAGVLRVGRQNFEIATFPREDFLKGLFARELSGDGVGNFPILHPNFSIQSPLSDVKNRRTAGKAFQLIQIDKTFTLHSAKAALVVYFTVEQRLDAILKKFDFLTGARLLPEKFHALRIGAGAIFLIQHPGQHHDAQMGKLAADNGQHLQPVHFWHAEVSD